MSAQIIIDFSKNIWTRLKTNVQDILKVLPIGIIIPVILTITFFMMTVFSFLLPYMQEALMDKKRELIKELVTSLHSTFIDFEYRHQAGELSLVEAQEEAIWHVQALRYGSENENYFWILGEDKTMFAHPFPSLDGRDVSTTTEPIENGRQIFSEMVDITATQGSGFLDYLWEDPRDETALVPVIAYVQIFEPWGWTMGTAISFEDVFYEIITMTERLKVTIGVILTLIALLLIYNIRTGVKSEVKREHAEESLAESEERFRTLIENVPVGIYRNNHDPLAKFFMINPALIKMLGINSPKDAKKIKLEEIFERQQEAQQFKTQLLKEGQIEEMEIKLRTQEGPNIWALINVRQIQEKDGSHYFDGMIENITERKKAAISLRKSYETLKQLDKEKDEFIAIASHEMRTPMGVINGYVSLLLGPKNEGINELQSGILEKVKNNVKRLLMLVNGMLDIQKLESGKEKAKLVALELNPIAKSLIEDFQVTCEPKKLKLKFAPQPKLNPTVMIDEAKTRQVLTNLIGNAIKFAQEKGKITVLVSQDPEKPDFIRVIVRDNGTGIPKEELKPIFEKFHQAQNHMEHTEEGTGLGLPICKQIIEKNFGGKIWAESTVGKGSDFIFLLKKATKKQLKK